MKEFFRYEPVRDRSACMDCGATDGVIRVQVWLADEGDREVVWHQCRECLQNESDTWSKEDEGIRTLRAWLAAPSAPLTIAWDIKTPEERGGLTLGEFIAETMGA
jgi:hypothetical protein